MKLNVKWLDKSVCLTHPELGVVRLLKDSQGAHYLEDIAAKYNAFDELIEALELCADTLLKRGMPTQHEMLEAAHIARAAIAKAK